VLPRTASFALNAKPMPLGREQQAGSAPYRARDGAAPGQWCGHGGKAQLQGSEESLWRPRPRAHL